MDDTSIIRATPAGQTIEDALIADPAGVLMCLDFDGTLAPIVPNPADARLPPATRHALTRLVDQLGQVAIITGRAARTVVALGRLTEFVGHNSFMVLGQYGVERWEAASDRYLVPDPPPVIATARQRIEALVAERAKQGADMTGIRIEDKTLAIGVHTRQTTDPAKTLTSLEPGLQAMAAELGLIVEPGRDVVELRAFATTKGDGVRSLIEQFQPRVLVVAGDDLGDLAGFEVVRRWQAQAGIGATIAVACKEQPAVARQADIVCACPSALGEWLNSLADRLAQPTAEV